MRIAVCDDEKMERESLCQEIRRAWADAEIEEFESGVRIHEQIRKGAYYDIVFLDILLDDSNGIEISRKERAANKRRYNNWMFQKVMSGRQHSV